MSRIYQGGQSQSSYKAGNRKQNYNPSQVLSKEQAIIKEGERNLRDLKTQDREARRQDSMSGLERQASDKVEVGQLEMQQLEASQILKQQQLVQKAELQTAELAAKAAQKMSQTTERGQVSIEQLADKNVLKMNELRENANLKLAQMQETNKLKSSQSLESGLQKLDQATKSNALKLNQQGKKLGLDYVNKADSEALRLQHADDSFLLSVEQAGKKADMQLATTAMQLGQQVDRANTQLLATTINSLISFAGTVATEVAEQGEAAEKKRIEQLSWQDVIASKPISDSGAIDPVITREANLRSIESAEGAAIEQVAPGDYKTQESLRRPGADASMVRSASIGQATSRGLTLDARLNDAQYNPETMVYDGAGRLVPIVSLRTNEEYKHGLHQIMQRFSIEDKISNSNEYGVKKAWAPKAVAAINSAIARNAGKITEANINQRSTVSANTTAHLAQTGDLQEAWNHAWKDAQTLGKYAGKGNLEKGKGALNDVISSTPNLEDLRKVRLDNGSTLGDHLTYGAVIDAEEKRRFDSSNDIDQMYSAKANIQVKETERAMKAELIAAGPDADVGAIKESYAAQLRSYGTAEGDDAATTLLSGDYKASPVLFQYYKDQIAKGKPSDFSEIITSFTEGRLTPEQFNALKKLDEFGDQLDQRITASGVPDAETLAGDLVKEASTVISKKLTLGTDGSNIDQINTLVTNSITPEIRNRLRAFALANPKAERHEFLAEAATIQKEIRARLKPAELDQGELKWSKEEGLTYSGIGNKNVAIQTTRSADGKQTITFYDKTNVVDIPKSATSQDRYLSPEQAQVAGQKYMAATPNDEYSPRIRQISRKLGLYPSEFVRKQLQGMGYTMSTDFNSTSAVQGGKAIDPSIMNGLNVIGKYESDTKGSYNAVNQRGIKGGLDVDGYSGHYSKLGGKDLTSMSLGEIMELQAPRPGMSNEQWKAEGRLHAVGRYQFVGKTLRGIAEAIGISPSEKFTPELQDRMGAWLLSEYGMGQWTGVTKAGGATAQEKALLTQVRQRLQEARAILSNPNAGNIQRARAMRIVGQAFG